MAVLNNWSPPRVSQLLVDADLAIPTGYKLRCNDIYSYDSEMRLRAAASPTWEVKVVKGATYINGSCRAPSFRKDASTDPPFFPYGLQTPSIEKYGGGGIDILDSVAFAAGKSASVDSLLTDSISERTGSANISLNSKVLVDHIGEKTASHDIVFDDDIQAQEDFEAKLTQDYLSAHDGAVVRWTSASEETAVNPGVSPGVVIKTVTVPAEYADPNCSFRVLYSHKTTSAIQGRCRVAINGIPVGAGIISDTSYTDSSEVVTGVTAGDTIDIMCWSESGSDLTAYVKDFVVKSADSIYHPVGASPTWT